MDQRALPFGTSPRPLANVIQGFPEWVKWILCGIIAGRPLDADEIRQHVVDDDPAPPLPDVSPPATTSPAVLLELRLGEGCYGLAPGTTIEFGRRFTLIYGENGSGKSSLSRLLRAIAGRPSAERPPANRFTGRPAKATLVIEQDGSRRPFTWHADSPNPGPHIDVFDSADTRVDRSEYQVRPRSLVALEELRAVLDELRFTPDALEIPDSIRSALGDEDLAALNDPLRAEEALDRWWNDAGSCRSTKVIEAELAALDIETLARQRTEIELHNRLAQADVELLGVLEDLSLPSLTSRIRAGATSSLHLAGIEPPPGVTTGAWLGFLHQALPLLVASPGSCPLCTSAIPDRHAQLVAAYRTLLADQRGQLIRDLKRGLTTVREAVAHHRGATEDRDSPVRELAVEVAELLDRQEADQLDEVAVRLASLDKPTRSQFEAARTEWEEWEAKLKDAEVTRSKLREELAAARRSEAFKAHPDDVEALRTQVRRRARLAPVADLRRLKQRLNTAIRQHTDEVLQTTYGQALTERLRQFRVPHADRLTAQHVAKGGQTSRRHLVDRIATDVLFSEGEQRALALADFAAELDARGDARHPVVFDDPVSSLDYRRIEQVHDYVRELLDRGRQVIVFTHSLWLAASLLHEVRKTDVAKTLVRTGGQLGTTTPLNSKLFGSADRLKKQISNYLEKAERATDIDDQHQLIAHALGLLRAWCEAFVEQKVLSGVVTRLDWQVRPNNLRHLDQQKLDAGRAVAALYNKLHQRVDAHAQPGELLHRRDGLADLKELWAEAQRIEDSYAASSDRGNE